MEVFEVENSNFKYSKPGGGVVYVRNMTSNSFGHQLPSHKHSKRKCNQRRKHYCDEASG